MSSTIASARAPARWRSRASWRSCAGLIIPVTMLYYLALHWSIITAGAAAVRTADRDWLTIGAIAVVLTWVAASSCQAGAVAMRLPLRPLFATQVAGSFLNHVLPAGVGQAGLNLRLLKRSGLSTETAAGALAVNAAAGVIVHVVALVAVLTWDPASLHISSLSPSAAIWTMSIIAMLAGAVAVVGGTSKVLSRLADRARRSFAGTRSVLSQPSRAWLLWGGSAALPLLHVLILVAALRALHHPAPLLPVAAIYLTCSTVAAALPSPGGFGSLDVALASGLYGTGLSAPSAAAVVIAYRLLTVWLPMLPGAVVFGLLTRRPPRPAPPASGDAPHRLPRRTRQRPSGTPSRWRTRSVFSAAPHDASHRTTHAEPRAASNA